jgi:hypothetical protein|tara:strand:+ start:845 stop:1000 length:156 start_codon:yes stop_codon:yes gene_type:complete
MGYSYQVWVAPGGQPGRGVVSALPLVIGKKEKGSTVKYATIHFTDVLKEIN